MLIFQINPNQLEKGQEIRLKDWAFWNTYIKSRVDEQDYVLLPSYINYITNTEENIETQYMLELDENDEDSELTT